jgi:hypothetical protein
MGHAQVPRSVKPLTQEAPQKCAAATASENKVEEDVVRLSGSGGPQALQAALWRLPKRVCCLSGMQATANRSRACMPRTYTFISLGHTLPR